MTTGKFITFEGGEGTGKSTLIAALSYALDQKGFAHTVTREPGGTPRAEAVRTLALSPPGDKAWSPLAHALLMNAARQDHLENVIRPQIEQGGIVLCDRFSDSTRAYQSVDGISINVLRGLEKAVVADTTPDLTLILDADPLVLQKRRTDRGVMDHFERKDIEFHQNIRKAFLTIAQEDPKRCIIVDAAQNQQTVLDTVTAMLASRFGWDL